MNSHVVSEGQTGKDRGWIQRKLRYRDQSESLGANFARMESGEIRDTAQQPLGFQWVICASLIELGRGNSIVWMP